MINVTPKFSEYYLPVGVAGRQSTHAVSGLRTRHTGVAGPAPPSALGAQASHREASVTERARKGLEGRAAFVRGRCSARRRGRAAGRRARRIPTHTQGNLLSPLTHTACGGARGGGTPRNPTPGHLWQEPHAIQSVQRGPALAQYDHLVGATISSGLTHSRNSSSVK